MGKGEKENLGLSRYLNVNFKISQVDCPLLANFLLEPFLFASGAVVDPVSKEGEMKFKDYLRYSLGFGFGCQLPSFAIEFYYSLLVSKGKNEDKNVM